MQDLESVLERSCRDHDHLCPRQILGARVGMAGLAALGFGEPPSGKQLLVITETDGCFADGVIAATGCSVGHRTLRVEDFGKTAATFVDVSTGRAVRVAPAVDARELARAWAPTEVRHYFAQMRAYRTIPDERLLSVKEVVLKVPVDEIVSRAGVRARCQACGEEIINEREVLLDAKILCRACAGDAYYRLAEAERNDEAPALLALREPSGTGGTRN